MHVRHSSSQLVLLMAVVRVHFSAWRATLSENSWIGQSKSRRASAKTAIEDSDRVCAAFLVAWVTYKTEVSQTIQEHVHSEKRGIDSTGWFAGQHRRALHGAKNLVALIFGDVPISLMSAIYAYVRWSKTGFLWLTMPSWAHLWSLEIKC